MIGNKWVFSEDFSSDDQYLAFCRNGLLEVCDVETEQIFYTFPHGREIWVVVAFSPNGFLVAGGSDRNVVIRDIRTGQKIREFMNEKWTQSVSFSVDGKYLAIGSFGRIAIIWDIPSERIIAVHPHKKCIYSIAFSPDGKYFATGSLDKTVAVWNIKTGKKIREFEHDKEIFSVAFSQDGRYLLVATESTIKVYDWRKRELVRETATRATAMDVNCHGHYYMYRENLYGATSFFGELHVAGTTSLKLSRRGFMAIGYVTGGIRIIREGKERDFSLRT